MFPIDPLVLALRYFIPSAWSIAFRAVAFGYTTKRRVALGFATYTVYTLVVPACLTFAFGYDAFICVAVPVMVIGSLAVLIFSTDTPGKTIFLQLAQEGMVICMSVLLNMACAVLGFSYPVLVLLLALCSPLLFFIALRFWAAPLRFLADNIHGPIGPLLALPLLTLTVASIIPVYPPDSFASHPVFCAIVVLLVETVFFLYLFTMKRNLEQISLLLKKEARGDHLIQEVASYRDYLEAARQNRHDLRHHDMLLLNMLEEGRMQEAIEYLQVRDREYASTSLSRFCDDATMNAVLRIFERRAEEAKVSFSALVVLPETMPLDQPELGALLGNVLENALNAASDISDGHIVFDARYEDGSLLMEARNSMAGRVEFRGGMPVSRRTGGGTGTRSIVSIVERHGGIVEYSQAGQEFRTRIIIPVPETMSPEASAPVEPGCDDSA